MGDSLLDCKLALYSDVDFAGDLETSNGTTGAFLVLIGPSTFFPLSVISTAETGILSREYGLRTGGMLACVGLFANRYCANPSFLG